MKRPTTTFARMLAIDPAVHPPWRSTKITLIIAVPCVIFIAWLQRMTDQVLIFAGLMVFVMVAVPWKSASAGRE